MPIVENTNFKNLGLSQGKDYHIVLHGFKVSGIGREAMNIIKLMVLNKSTKINIHIVITFSNRELI